MLKHLVTMHQTLIAVIVLCAVCATLADDMAKAFPTIDSNFFTNTKEVTYTGPDDTTGTTVVEQDLVWDVDLRRSRMVRLRNAVYGSMHVDSIWYLVLYYSWSITQTHFLFV